MKHSEVIDLRNKLESTSGLVGFEITFCIKKNLQRIKTALEPLVEMETEHEKIIVDFNADLKTTRESFAKVDGEVKYKPASNKGALMYDVPDEKLPALKSAIAELRKKHQAKVDEYEAVKKDYKKFLSETESDFVLTTVKQQYVPKDISQDNMECIYDLIVE